MYIHSEELILTIANDGECYKRFIEACQHRFFTGEWSLIPIIAYARMQLSKLSNGETIEYEVGAIRDARIYLENRYYSHFLAEIAQECINNAQNELKMWEETRKNV